MKTLLIFFSTLFLSLTSYATCDDSHQANKGSVRTASTTPFTKQIQLTGMTCGGCVKNVSNALKSVPLAKGVKFNVDINLVTIDYSGNKKLPKTELDKIVKEAEAAITKAKYKVVKDQA